MAFRNDPVGSRRASIRSIAQGTSGLRLRHAAGRARIPEVADPALARRLAGRRAPALPLPPEDVAALAALWPEISSQGPDTNPD